MKSITTTIENIYLKWPIIWDLLLGICAYLLMIKFEPYLCDYIRENQENNLVSLISTNVSLAGFVIAALTIIITFKENIQAKSIGESKSGLELLFNSPIYKSLIYIFVFAIAEFVLAYMILFLVNIFSNALTKYQFSSVLFSLLIISFLTALRIILILFKIIKLQLKSKTSN